MAHELTTDADTEDTLLAKPCFGGGTRVSDDYGTCLAGSQSDTSELAERVKTLSTWHYGTEAHKRLVGSLACARTREPVSLSPSLRYIYYTITTINIFLPSIFSLLYTVYYTAVCCMLYILIILLTIARAYARA